MMTVDVVGGGLTARGGVSVGVVCGDRGDRGDDWLLSSSGGGSMSNGFSSCPIITV